MPVTDQLFAQREEHCFWNDARIVVHSKAVGISGPGLSPIRPTPYPVELSSCLALPCLARSREAGKCGQVLRHLQSEPDGLHSHLSLEFAQSLLQFRTRPQLEGLARVAVQFPLVLLIVRPSWASQRSIHANRPSE